MPPRRTRRDDVGTPPVRRHSPSGSSIRSSNARSSAARLPEMVRTPMTAKYSISYGSPLAQLPDRSMVGGGGKISSAAAAVFQRVQRDNQASRARRFGSAEAEAGSSTAPTLASGTQPAADEVDLLPDPAGDVSQGGAVNRTAAENAAEDEDEESQQTQAQPQRNPVNRRAERAKAEREKAGREKAERERVSALRSRNEKEKAEAAARLQEQRGAAEKEAEAAAARREDRKRARDDAEAEAKAERERIERDARLRREKSAEARRRAEQRHADAHAAERLSAQNRAPAAQNSSHLLATPATVAGRTLASAVQASARSYIEESQVYNDAEVETPNPQSQKTSTRRSGRPTTPPRPPRPILPRPIPNAGLPAVPSQPAVSPTIPEPLAAISGDEIPGWFSPTFMDPLFGLDEVPVGTDVGSSFFVSERQPEQPSRAPLPSRHVTYDEQPGFRTAQAELEGIFRPPVSTLPGTRNPLPSFRSSRREAETQAARDESVTTSSDDESDHANRVGRDTTSASASSTAQDRQKRPHVQQDAGKKDSGGDRSAPTDTGTNRRAPFSFWPNIKRLSTSWNTLKVVLILLFLLPTLNFLRPDEHRPIVMSDEQFSKLAGYFQDSSQLAPGARENLESILPRMIYVRRDQAGNLVIDNEFWHAIKDRIQKDDSIFTLDSKSGIPEQQWKAIQSRLKSDTSGPTTESWERWLQSNHEKVVNFLKEPMEKALRGRPQQAAAVTRDEFIREVEKSVARQKTTEEMQRSLQDLLQDVRKLQSSPKPPAGMTKDEVKKLVDGVIKKAIGNAQLQRTAKGNAARRLDSELEDQVNHFAPGNGALVDISLTSPTWTTQRPWVGSWAFWRARAPPSIKEKFTALTSWQEAGHCWCAGILGAHNTTLPADIAVYTANLFTPQHVVIEHINPDATIDPKSMPKDVEVWALVEEQEIKMRADDWSASSFPSVVDDDSVREEMLKKNGFTKIGKFRYEYTADNNGVYVHRLSAELESIGLWTNTVVVRALSNYGAADHTCFYRIKMYGQAFTPGPDGE